MISRISFIVLILISFPLYAHESDSGGDFVVGLLHPVLGLDHLLAMLSVGIVSSQIGGKAIWTIPCAFIVMMFVGGLVGLGEIELAYVEFAIVLSVLCLGLVITIGKRIPTKLTMIVVGLFAIYHGYAHGSEMPYMAQAALYSLGFITGTAGIHIAGVLIALLVNQLHYGKNILRCIGAAITGAGITFLIMMT